MTTLELNPKWHGIARDSWEQRFAKRIRDKASLDHPEMIIAAELESWPTSDAAWVSVLPEDAADDNMMEWTPDE